MRPISLSLSLSPAPTLTQTHPHARWQVAQMRPIFLGVSDGSVRRLYKPPQADYGGFPGGGYPPPPGCPPTGPGDHRYMYSRHEPGDAGVAAAVAGGPSARLHVDPNVYRPGGLHVLPAMRGGTGRSGICSSGGAQEPRSVYRPGPTGTQHLPPDRDAASTAQEPRSVYRPAPCRIPAATGVGEEASPITGEPPAGDASSIARDGSSNAMEEPSGSDDRWRPVAAGAEAGPGVVTRPNTCEDVNDRWDSAQVSRRFLDKGYWHIAAALGGRLDAVQWQHGPDCAAARPPTVAEALTPLSSLSRLHTAFLPMSAAALFAAHSPMSVAHCAWHPHLVASVAASCPPPLAGACPPGWPGPPSQPPHLVALNSASHP